jgi:hypothetical protein
MSKALFESLKMDLPALAEMLRSKGRGKDTMLAHITPKEAALLKRRGGSGSVNPDTGLPEFEDSGDYTSGSVDYNTVAPVSPAYDVISGGGGGGQDLGQYTITPGTTAGFAEAQKQQDFEQTPAKPYTDLGLYPGGVQPDTTTTQTVFTPSGQSYNIPRGQYVAPTPVEPGAVTPPGQEDKSIADRLGLKASDLTRLGLGGLVTGGLTAQNLARTRQAQQQAGQAQGELQALGTPYQAQGKELVRAAQSGELTPANQQIVNAARAQANQAVATRGGVGQQQAQNSISDLTARLLQGQYDLGLKVMNIGDNYVSGAIKTGLQADQMVNQANQQFYASLAQMAAPFLLGQQPVYQVTPPRA